MYEAYYGLRERPFDLSPNPRFLFLSAKHREALTHLKYGLTGRPGVTVLIGDAGTGKTTLVRAAIQASNGSSAAIVHLSNPTLTRTEFYEYLAAGFGFGSGAASSKTRFLAALGQAITNRQKADAVPALVVDEAQSVPHELLEEIRLLTNLEGATGQSLAVALVGQPELAVRLNDTSLRQLKQRVALRCELAPLDLNETASYIAARVRIAGGHAETIFTRDAVREIHTHAKGIPRTVSVICDNALVNGFAADVKPVGRDVVLSVCHDFQLDEGNVSPAVPTSAAQPAATGEPSLRTSSPRASGEGPREESGRQPLFSRFTRSRRFF